MVYWITLIFGICWMASYCNKCVTVCIILRITYCFMKPPASVIVVNTANQYILDSFAYLSCCTRRNAVKLSIVYCLIKLPATVIGLCTMRESRLHASIISDRQWLVIAIITRSLNTKWWSLLVYCDLYLELGMKPQIGWKIYAHVTMKRVYMVIIYMLATEYIKVFGRSELRTFTFKHITLQVTLSL